MKKVGRGLKEIRSINGYLLKRVIRNFNTKEKIALAIFGTMLFINLGIVVQGFYIQNTNPVPAHGGKYEEGLVGEPRHINPLLAQTQTDKDLTALTYSGLYKFDNKGNMIPDLAEGNVQISEDQKQYTVKLKKDLKWHDGRKLTVDDILFTVETLKNPEYQSPLRRVWQNIELQKVDEETVVFTNKDISAPFLSNLTLGLIPKHIWEQVGPANFVTSKFNLEPVGSGPYFVREIKKTSRGELQTITFESYSNYANGKPYIDRVVTHFHYKSPDDLVLALRTKDVDGIGYTPFETALTLKKKKSIQTLEVPQNQYQALFFNLAKLQNRLGDRSVREAFAKSIDREEFINDVYNGYAQKTYGPIMPKQVGYFPEIEKMNVFNLQEANEILDKSGWVRDPNTGTRSKGNQQLKFTITTNDFAINAKSANELKEQWSRIGADITVSTVATGELERTVIGPRNFEALLFSERTGFDSDPFVFWHSSQSKNPGLNLAQYNNPLIDKLITDARSTFNSQARTEKYTEFQKTIATDLPAIFLTQSEFIYHLPKNIKGIGLETIAAPEDRFYDLPNWYLESNRSFR
jgi:peptide/nickel transport system substrate-binding protein